MMRALIFVLLAVPGLARAQDAASLADIRADLDELNAQVLALRSELSGDGTASMNLSGTGVLQRVDLLEAEVRRLTGQTERLSFRIDSIVSDATNRVGDLEFRICEIEPGCDIGSIGQTTTIGGDTGTAPPPRTAPAPAPAGAQLAVGEQEEFDRAKEALDSGSFRSAADLLETFATTYTSGPLTTEAHFLRAQALSELGNDAEAARAYLEAFSAAPDGPRAPDALLNLGVMLNDLGQRADACSTLSEVSTRYPDAPAAIAAQSSFVSIGCS